MLAKAHITIGIAAALTIAAPDSIPDALPVITGASLGCLICDLDCDNPREKQDSSHWRSVMFAVAAAALFEDYHIDAGMWRSLTQSGSYLWCAGVAGFALTCAFASVSSHRGFSHSLAALAPETVSLWLVFPAAAIPFVIAFTSHLILDMTNKRPVRILYPLKKGISFGWFYADRLANKVCAATGSVWLIVTALVFLRQH